MKPLLFVALLVLLTGPDSGLYADRRFTAPSGSDFNSGHITHPWATLSHAVAQLQAGDTLFVRGGHYGEGEIWIREKYGMGGRNGKYLTIMAYKNEKPVFTNSQRGMIVNASYVRVQGLHFLNGKEMYTVNWDNRSSHVCFIGNTFAGRAGYAAISITGDDHLVANNTIQLDGNSLGTQGHGIYVMEGARNVIRGNTISGMSGYGIHVYDEHKSEDPAGFRRVIQEVVIEENVICKSLERSGIIVGVGADGGPAYANHVIIRNNTVYDCRSSGIVIQGWSDIRDVQIDQNTLYDNSESSLSIGGRVDGVKVRNNILFQTNKQPQIRVEPTVSHVLIDYNQYFPAPRTVLGAVDAHALEGDPGFVNASKRNFRLTGHSPAIDAGINLGRPFSGKAPDLGAFEYGEQPPSEEQGEETSDQEPVKIGCLQNSPNPFCQDTLIYYHLLADEFVAIDIYNNYGQHCQRLVQAYQSQGRHEVRWDGLDKDGRRLPAGLYFCRLQTDSLHRVAKMLRIL